jgi:hypothetical protein
VSPLAEKIMSHGYWRVLVRPANHIERRIENVTELFPLVQRLSVQLRGWDFPHIDLHDSPTIGDNWAGQDSEWEHHLERWRIYQSGQFVYLGAFTVDWAKHTENWLPSPPKPPCDSLLSVSDAVCRFAEFFEFASALALSRAGDNPMYVEVGCYGIKDRELWLDAPNRVPFTSPQKASVPQFVQNETFSRETLAAETRAIGNLWTKELFRRFNWDASDGILEALRTQFR